MMWFYTNRMNGEPFVPFYLPGTPKAVYSTRKLVSDYSGYSVNVRRNSDNSTIDIGFVGNDFDVSTAQTFSGAQGLLFVTKFYDQSGNGLDVSSITQPQLIIINGKAWLSFSGGDNNLIGNSGSLSSTTMTIGFVIMNASDNCTIPINDISSGWFLELNNTGAGTSGVPGNERGSFNIYATAVTSDSTNRLYQSQPNFLAATFNAGAMQTYVNGSPATSATGASISPTSGGFQIGSFGGNYVLDGLLSDIYIYSSALTQANILSIESNQSSYWPAFDFNSPYISNSSALQFGVNEYASPGNVLNYERTQGWTAFAAIQLYKAPSTATVIWTNVPVPGDGSYPGYEGWVDSNGFLRVRIMHNIGAGNYIGIIGTTNVIDGKKHSVTFSYDGSSTAAGVKIYIDGIPETTTVESDTLSGSIIGSGQSFYIGNQQGDLTFNLRGTLGLFQIDNVVRSSSYISTYSSRTNLPPIDINTVMSYHFTEKSGTTLTDGSSSGFTANLTSSGMWIT